ncbi:expressed unknown protein [Seminavis robusta]|uniref:Acylphosphatase-like domain-containing protein n=1 Tax=Seminavis robusta TaxID=568900 RepID=A0A9N8DYX7_9STRA|nr:expressed unknown protein [Seminavis robusta]|eukprot:Sro352_g124340.1 n/a (133) ;mRNA; r:63914-64496
MGHASAFLVTPRSSTSPPTTSGNTALFLASTDHGDDDFVAKRIIVKGDVQGGYYRSCVLNEAGRFRRLVGTMSPPDDTDTAEIYVEGNSKMVEGFVRWCKRSKVGMSQVVGVEEVRDEEPTGLYDDFYCKTH